MSSKTIIPSIIEILNNFLSQIKIIEFNDKKIVIKEYSREYGLFKWFLLKTGSDISKTYPYTIDPYERMMRETVFFEEMNSLINVPNIFVKDWVNSLIIREYIDGDSSKPDYSDNLKNIAKIIASIHDYSYVLGDTKFYNFIKTSNKYYIIDAEQAIRSNNEKYMYWDLFVFITISIYYVINKYLTKATSISQYVINEFLLNYINERGSRALDVLKNYDSINYKSLIYILLPIPYSTQYIKVINSIIK